MSLEEGKRAGARRLGRWVLGMCERSAVGERARVVVVTAAKSEWE